MYPTPRKDDVSHTERFFRTLLSALNPRSYHLLSQRPIGSSLKYLFWTVLFCTGVMLLLAIPNIFNLPAHIQNELNRFNSLSVDFTAEMNAPFVLTPTTPMLTIDTTNSSNPSDSILHYDGQALRYHLLPFTDPVEIGLTEGDLLTNGENIAAIAWGFILLLLPGLLLLMLLMLYLKYVLLILLSAFLGFILTGIIRFQIRFVELLNVAIYSTTIALVIELFTKPFLINSFYLHYVFFAIYFILGMIGAGDFEPTHPKRMKKEFM